MADLKHTIALASKVTMKLKSLLDARKESNEELLDELREEFDFQEAL